MQFPDIIGCILKFTDSAESLQFTSRILYIFSTYYIFSVAMNFETQPSCLEQDADIKCLENILIIALKRLIIQ